jgi:hypothetical protein
MNARYVLLLLSALCHSAWAAPAQVLVVAKVESKNFRSGLGAAVPATEAAIAKNLATQLKAMFPPLDWITTAPADGAAATLTATLAQDDELLPNIVLRWSAKIGTENLPLHAVREWPVYESSIAGRPYRDPEGLISFLDAKIKSRLNTDNTEAKIHDDFIKAVPLATRIEFDKSADAVLIPISWSTAQISDESLFRLEFIRPAPAGRIKVLLGATERMLEPMKGRTQGKVASCVAGGSAVPDNIWSTCVAILEQQGAPPLSLSFERYKFAGNVSGISTSGTSEAP